MECIKLPCGIALLGFFLALGPAPVQAAKKKPGSPAPAAAQVVRETVYVRESAPSGTGERDRLRPHRSAYGISASLYAADLLGTSPFGYLSYDFYPLPSTPFFMEVTAGAGFAQSDFSTRVVGREFDPNLLAAVEVLAGFNIGAPSAPGASGGLYPYWLAGVAGLYQGSSANVGVVLGFGHRVGLPWIKRGRRWALIYGVRDHVYSQKIDGNPSLTQNPIVHFGILRYY